MATIQEYRNALDQVITALVEVRERMDSLIALGGDIPAGAQTTIKAKLKTAVQNSLSGIPVNLD